MSLNQKYTWNDFLKENPELKEKQVKRTSPEGKKAFEAAYKAKVKDVLKERLVWIDKEVKRAGSKKSALVTDIKAKKTGVTKRVVQDKIGKAEKYLHRLEKMTKKTKQVQKNF
jgi:hypothetical protein